MKKILPLLSALFLVTSCGTSPAISSSQSSSQEATTSVTSEESTQKTSEDKTSSEASTSIDPYAGRVKPVDMSILDLTNGVTDANDPRYYEDAKPLEAYLRPNKVRMYYLDEINDVYYIDLASYASIFQNELATGITSSISEKDGVSTWSLKKGEDLAYKLELDANKKTVTTFSAIDTDYVTPIYNGRNGLMDLCTIEQTDVKGHENKPVTVSFDGYGMEVLQADGKNLYPFPLLALETSMVMERSFLNLSAKQMILEYGKKEQIENTNFKLTGEQTILASEYFSNCYNEFFKEKDAENHPIEPESTRKFNKGLIYFLMDNYYGLAKERGVKAMREYFENYEYSSDFTNAYGKVRGSAYNRAFMMLNDLHSSYGYSGFFGEYATDEAVPSQCLYNERVDLFQVLSSMRKAALARYDKENGTTSNPSDLRYSKDNKYAYFSFDSFATFSYFEKGDIPESEYLGDTFYLFVKRLNEAKAKGVKRVIIDDSCNGGGYVAIMGKLLALMSKDNRSEMFMRNDGNAAINRIITRVDSNKDGVYDEKDCFGNDFQFYIATSNYSFSCGNAFPFYAGINKYARILGTRSGGGECAVYGYTLPTGQSLGYSSPYHIGYYDEKADKFDGDEAGAAVTFTITPNFFDIYDIDQCIARIEPLDGKPA